MKLNDQIRTLTVTIKIYIDPYLRTITHLPVVSLTVFAPMSTLYTEYLAVLNMKKGNVCFDCLCTLCFYFHLFYLIDFSFMKCTPGMTNNTSANLTITLFSACIA